MAQTRVGKNRRRSPKRTTNFLQSTSAETFSRRLPIYRVLSALVVVLTVVVCSIEQIRYVHWGGDARVFVSAARTMLRGEDIINFVSPSGLYYVYPPLFACLFIPFTLLPIDVVIVLWELISVGLLGWAIAAFYAAMNERKFFLIDQKTRWSICFLATLLSARFILFHLTGGQSDIVVMAAIVFGLVKFSRQKLLSGLAIGFAIVIKILALPFCVWFFARRKLTVIAGIVLGGLTGVALPALVVGPRLDWFYHVQWFKRVILHTSPGSEQPIDIGNLSLRAQLSRFFLGIPAFEYRGRLYSFTIVELPPRYVFIMTAMLMLGIVWAIGFYASKFKDEPTLVSRWGGYAFVFSLIPLFSTWTEIHHLVFLVPPYLYVVHLWHSHLVTDRLFKILIMLSFLFTSLTTKAFLGTFISRSLTALGFITAGLLFLSLAIFRAAVCLSKSGPRPQPDILKF